MAYFFCLTTVTRASGSPLGCDVFEYVYIWYVNGSLKVCFDDYLNILQHFTVFFVYV